MTTISPITVMYQMVMLQGSKVIWAGPNSGYEEGAEIDMSALKEICRLETKETPVLWHNGSHLAMAAGLADYRILDEEKKLASQPVLEAFDGRYEPLFVLYPDDDRPEVILLRPAAALAAPQPA